MANVFLLQRSFQNYILAFFKYTTFDINSPSLDRENCSKSDQPIIYKIKDFLWYVFFISNCTQNWGGFFSIFIVVSMMKDSIFKKLFLQRRSRNFSWRNNNNNLLLNLMCHLCYSSMCAYLTIYLHQTSSFSVVHTYSGPLTIILVTITVSAKIREKN